MINSKVSKLQEKRQALLKKREQLLASFSQAVTEGKRKRVASVYKQIRQTNRFIGSLAEIENEVQPAAVNLHRRYAVSSLFLHESFKKLTLDEAEQFFFITGTEIDGVLVLDQWAEFAHQKRSMLGVTADTKSTHGLLIKLEQFGHRLLAHFHSHPGKGIDSTQPSGIDRDFQRRLERAGHVAVMAIFSRDGYVRFLRLDNNLEVEVYGSGVEKHDANVYHLTNVSQA